MIFTEVNYPKEKALDLSNFKDMDYFVVNNYHLPIELMMEGAGLQLARLVANFTDIGKVIKIGVGNGNNGGGGLVAALRLSAWGYNVYLDIFTNITKSIPLLQLERALLFGAKNENISNPDVWIDAYLGFSQRLPLNEKLLKTIRDANASKALKISLDIPTGFLGDTNIPFFHADKVLTLAAPKKILYNLHTDCYVFIADIGIPKEIYTKFETDFLPFHKGSILKLNR